jgi:16S rRNA (cytosine967-C5)-methyltransferase
MIPSVPNAARRQTRTPPAAPAPARRCAHAVLLRVFEQGAYADRAFHAQATGLDPRDRALAMRLAYGTVQRRGTLDHLIERLTDRPVQKLDAGVRAALRLGLYEMLYLRSPDYAVVADAVELSKGGGGGRGGGGAHGLVNAVLRRAGREGAEALLGTLGDSTPQAAAVKHSHPLWIVELWWEMLGADGARALMAADNEAGEIALRANTLVLSGGADELAQRLEVQGERDSAIPEALVLGEPLDLHNSPLWAEGAFIAQSRAAMLVGRALAPLPGERVLDLCAAPGGKSTHIAALMQRECEVLAVERNPARARELQETVRRLCAGSVRVDVADAAVPRPEGASFDRVLVDPPCSGLGTLQARPDLRWRVQPQGLGQLSALQAQILSCGAAALRPGGVLVYSTCTISAIENERLIHGFLDSHPDFSLDDLAAGLPAPPLSDALAPGSGGTVAGADRLVLTLPHRDRTAGFFIARLRRS